MEITNITCKLNPKSPKSKISQPKTNPKAPKSQKPQPKSNPDHRNHTNHYPNQSQITEFTKITTKLKPKSPKSKKSPPSSTPNHGNHKIQKNQNQPQIKEISKITIQTRPQITEITKITTKIVSKSQKS